VQELKGTERINNLRRVNRVSTRAMIKSFRTIAVLTVLSAGVPLAGGAASPGVDGEHLYRFHGCVNCHGDRGLEPVREGVPRIGGLPTEKIVDRARAIIEARMDGVGMKRWARDLYDSCNAPPSMPDLERIAEWLPVAQE
jgi:mono/diheme cytochrome c family protein